MITYRSEWEVLKHFGRISKTTLADRPVNHRTKKYYTEGSWLWWFWWYGLSDEDKNAYGKMTA